jgi:predicted metalloprotease with PDZ domain
MRRTGGKSSLGSVYRELFRRYARGEKPADGNAAVAASLGATAGMGDFVERYVVGAEEIVLSPLLQEFGLRVEPGGARTHVGVAPAPDSTRRELLRKLGYNENADAESRKLHERLRKRAPQ